MVAFNKFHSFVEYLAHGIYDLENDTLKIALSNAAPTASNSALSDITEISAGNGYTSGGFAVNVTGSGQTDGVYALEIEDLSVLADGGALGPFRYVVLYDDTPDGDPLIGWWDYGASLTLQNGETVLLNFSEVTGALTIQ